VKDGTGGKIIFLWGSDLRKGKKNSNNHAFGGRQLRDSHRKGDHIEGLRSCKTQNHTHTCVGGLLGLKTPFREFLDKFSRLRNRRQTHAAGTQSLQTGGGKKKGTGGKDKEGGKGGLCLGGLYGFAAKHSKGVHSPYRETEEMRGPGRKKTNATSSSLGA